MQEKKLGGFVSVPFTSQSICLSGGLGTQPACCPSVCVCLQCLLQRAPSQQVTELQCLVYPRDMNTSESALN